MLSGNLRVASLWKLAKHLSYSSTAATQNQELVLVEINDKTGISTVTMNSPPVNSMTLNFFKEFCDKMDLLEKEKVKGMILTSSLKNVYSSGLDFQELHKPEESRINAYWVWFQESWLKLYGASFPTVALINGHAPAGGCVYALSCEYRVMLPNFTIGLNEAPVGIIPPSFVIACMKNTLSNRKSELALTLGTLFTTAEALDLGLIDEVATDKADATARSEAFLNKYSKIPPEARAGTKQTFRKDDLEYLKNPQNRSADAKAFIDHLLRPSTQSDIENYVANLKKAKK